MKKILFLLLLITNVLIAQNEHFEKVSIKEEQKLNEIITERGVLAAPVNNNCASATVLTLDGVLLCSQTTDQATLQGSECFTAYAGATELTVWYRFTSTNDSMILNFIVNNTVNCSPHIRVYGPYADGAGCLPPCGAVYSALQNADPGSHILLTGLASSGDSDYLIQIQGNECGGPNDRFTNFCIGISNVSSNAYSTGANSIYECGSSFGGSTNGGYFQNGSSVGFNNLDGNAATTCGGCTAGDDTPFIINNISWFKFCSLVSGTWQVTVNGISGCQLSAPNAGIQASIFTGTTSALTNQGNSASPLAPGASYTSPIITVNNGECAYLMIDGFAGDACDYDVTLTNITGGCVVLPIELLYFTGQIKSCLQNQLVWSTASETNNDKFEIERRSDDLDFKIIGTINGSGNSNVTKKYSFIDYNPNIGLNYYRLKQVDFNGNSTHSHDIIAIDNTCISNLIIIKITNLLGQEVNSEYIGPRFIHYNNGFISNKFGY